MRVTFFVEGGSFAREAELGPGQWVQWNAPLAGTGADSGRRRRRADRRDRALRGLRDDRRRRDRGRFVPSRARSSCRRAAVDPGRRRVGRLRDRGRPLQPRRAGRPCLARLHRFPRSVRLVPGSARTPRRLPSSPTVRGDPPGRRGAPVGRHRRRTARRRTRRDSPRQGVRGRRVSRRITSPRPRLGPDVDSRRERRFLRRRLPVARRAGPRPDRGVGRREW